MKRIHALPAHTKAMLASMLGFFCFCTCDIFQKLLSTDYSPATIGTYGMLSCLTFFYGFSALGGNLHHFKKPLGLKIYAVRAVLLAVQYYLFLYAIAHLPMANVYTMGFTMPLVLTVLVALFLHEKPTPLTLAVLCIGFAGVLVALRPGDWQISHATMAAIAYGILMAFSNFCIRFFPRDDHWMVKSAVPITIEVALFVLIAFALGMDISTPALDHVPYFLALGGLMALGLCLLPYAFANGPAAIVAPFQYTGLIWGTVYGWLFFGSIIDIWTLSGAALIIGAGLWLFLSQKAPKPLPAGQNSPKKDE